MANEQSSCAKVYSDKSEYKQHLIMLHSTIVADAT